MQEEFKEDEFTLGGEAAESEEAEVEDEETPEVLPGETDEEEF